MSGSVMGAVRRVESVKEDSVQSLKQILGIIIVALALYGAYALFVSKKPVNDSVPQDFIDELANDGFGDIQNPEGAEGKSAFFNTLTGAPPLPSQGKFAFSGASSSVPSSLLDLDDFDEIEEDLNTPNLHSTAPLYGNPIENPNDQQDEAPVLDETYDFDLPAPVLDEAPLFDMDDNSNNNNDVCASCVDCVEEKKTTDENLFGDGPYSLTVPFSKKISPNGVLPDEKLIPTSEVYAQELITSNTLEDFSSVPTEDVLSFPDELPLFDDFETPAPNLAAAEPFELPPLDVSQDTPTALPEFETDTPNLETPVLEQFTEQFAEGVADQIADTLSSGLERFNEPEDSSHELPAQDTEGDMLMKMLPKVVRPLPSPREELLPLPATTPTAMSLASGTVPVNRLPNEFPAPMEPPVLEEATPDIPNPVSDPVPVPIAPGYAASAGDFDNIPNVAEIADTGIIEPVIPLQQETEAITQELSFSDFESQTPKAPTLPGIATSTKKKNLPGLDTVFPLDHPIPEENAVPPQIEEPPALEPIVDPYRDVSESEPVLNSFPLMNEPLPEEPLAVSAMNYPNAPFPSAPSPELLSSAVPHEPTEEPVLSTVEESQPNLSRQSPPETTTIRPEIAERLARIRPILATGNYRTGHRQATVLYMGNLNAAEKEAVLPVASQCGWEAFFARRYDPYSFTRTVSSPSPNADPEEILKSLSGQYRVSPELIFKINGLQEAKDLISKKELKIPPGPFDAVILLSRKELVVTAHGLFACRFRIGIGKPELITETEYQIEVLNGEVQKYKNPRYIHENGEIGPGDPRNPLGTHWIGLDQAIGLHGTNDPKCLGTDNAAVEGFSLDNRDIAELYDMLSTESKIVIRP